jgi:hypothetical protein
LVFESKLVETEAVSAIRYNSSSSVAFLGKTKYDKQFLGIQLGVGLYVVLVQGDRYFAEVFCC